MTVYIELPATTNSTQGKVGTSLRASLAGLLQGLQLRLLQELCQTPVLERAPHGEPVKSQSHFLPAQEKPKKQALRGSLLWVHVV